MPPVPPDLIKVQLTFDLGENQGEVAVNGFHLKRDHAAGNLIDWPADVAEIATKVRDKFTAADRPMPLLASTGWLRDVRAYHLRAADGKAEHLGIATSGARGAGGGLGLPFDVACVVSLLTGVAGEVLSDPETGPSPAKRSRGRIFAGPIPSAAVSGNGRFGTAWVTTFLTAWAAFFNDVQGMTVGGGADPDSVDLVVLSRAGNATRQVRKLRVDDLPDTQRRRSNRQLPNRQEADIAVG